jgi:ATP-dependent RNA helicase DeaD
LPDDTESYTHRSGRTGRAGKTGTSIAIINLREKGKLREIERIIGKKFVQGEMPTATQICEKQLLKVIDDLEKVKVNEEEIAAFMPDIYRKLDWLSKEDLIKRMVSHEFNRFSEYYRDREEIEMPTDNRRDRSEQAGTQGGRREGGNRKAEKGYTRLFINLGKVDSFYPRELMDLLNKNTSHRVNLGRIDLMKSFSFFEVEERDTKRVLQALNNARFNGRKITVEVAGEESGGKPAEQTRPATKRYGKPAAAPAADRKRPSDKKEKPSREERGYTKSRGKKDDWKQFFQADNELRGAEPDFSEEGWAKRSKRKR